MREKYSRVLQIVQSSLGEDGLSKSELVSAASSRSDHSAAIDFPISLALITEVQKAIAGIVSLTAIRAFQVAAPLASLVIEIGCNSEACAAAAGDKKQFDLGLVASIGKISRSAK